MKTNDSWYGHTSRVSLQKLNGESASDLRQLLHCVRSTVGSLESIGRPVMSSEDLFVHLIVDLLDTRSRREWETSISDSSEPPSYTALQQFLDRRLHTLESLLPAKSETTTAKSGSGAGRQTRALHANKSEIKRGRCSLCSQEHYIMFCGEYKAMTAANRKQHVVANDLCTNCLGKHKVSKCQSKGTCSTCSARHHSSLHEAYQDAEVAKSSHAAHRPPIAASAVLLATARVRVADRHGVRHAVRALVDQGSETSLVAESLAQRLGLPRISTSVAVYGIGGKRTSVALGLVALELSPLQGGSPMAMSALILPQLTLYNGGARAERRVWDHLKGLELADPDYLAADPIELLLGADVVADILLQGLRRGGPQEPVAQQTTLGWILSGGIGETHSAGSARTYHCVGGNDLSALVKQFWEQEEANPASAPLSPDDQEAEDHYVRTHYRTHEGRYTVRLPLKSALPDLGATRRTAARSLGRMETRFRQDEHLRQLYTSFMREYEVLGHMSLATAPAEVGLDCFLPHHGVARASSVTTKLRVVFNGSSPIASGESLNRHVRVGPNLLPALADVLLRWRVHRYVMASDVEKMYRQILIDPADRHLQKILWRYDEHSAVQEYTLNTVTYGMACAPFLAIRTLKQLADDEEQRFLEGAAVLRRDVYVDDVLTGASSVSEAKEIQRQLRHLCMAGGFPLRKWVANCAELLSDIPQEDRSNHDSLSWQPQDSHSTLGLRWHPHGDSFSFATRSIAVTTFTKRSVLSLTARLFDPLGWLAPCVIRAKIMFQATWLRGIDWDTPLDDDEKQAWQSFQGDLPQIEEIQVPRHVHFDRTNSAGELHGFADASERAYGAVIYWRTGTSQGTNEVKLIVAKTRVAPLKQVSLPRLELCAATLLARLVAHVRRALGASIVPVHLWSDSTVALGWIRGHPTRWKTYVANRVAEIQTTVPEAQWHHLPGTENPADCASRGISPSELVSHPLWWQGPPWLLEGPSSWPAPPGRSADDHFPEERIKVHSVTTPHAEVPEPEELTRFSSWTRLIRTTAWAKRWLHRRTASCQPPPSGALSAAECEDARCGWLRVIQAAHYAVQLTANTRGTTASSPRSLRNLTPFTDSQGLLRVGGRLKHALLAFDERHPVILPRESHLTRLIVEACHRRTLHGGVQLTLGAVRQQYWIPQGRRLVKAVIQRCVTCVRLRAASQQQLMSSLPRPRVTPARSFLHTGVDYAGPIFARTSKGRGHRAHKAFLAAFVCLSTKAVHLEVASDYTAEAFLAAFRRFTARRGLCRCLYSDCGTNFVGADAQLRSFFAASHPDQRRIADQLASDQIQWRFNPPAAPHFGGLWEAAIKSLKHHLRRVLGDATLTFEEISTLLAQIEACLNSRPLQALSDDPDDLTALTPGHFLIGTALNAVPEPSLLDSSIGHLGRWQLLQRMRDHFWNRWSKEYLQSLIKRPKWLTANDKVRMGRLCLVRSENTPPTRWPLARITGVLPGEDGCVRVVTVRTAASTLTRPVAKLILLPDCDVDPTEERRA